MVIAKVLSRGLVQIRGKFDTDDLFEGIVGRIEKYCPFSGSDIYKREVPMIDDNPMYIRDYSKCVLCWRCVQVCAEDAQYTFALSFEGRGFETHISTFFDLPMPATTCVFCGQCFGVCPTGAIKPKREYLLEQGMSPQEITVLNSGRKKRRT